MIQNITNISREEFEKADPMYKIIEHEGSTIFGCFTLNSKGYYISWFSPEIKIDFKILEKENYLLIGVDLKVVVLCTKTGRVLFSLGLFSFFKGFDNTNELAITIFTELEDIIVNKNGLSISQIIHHELDF
jgi:hypothetical protein